MPVFLMSYDAHNERDYEPLYKEMRRVGAARLLESDWIGELENTVAEVRDWLSELLDGDDSIVVIQIKPKLSWATRNVNKRINDKLRELI